MEHLDFIVTLVLCILHSSNLHLKFKSLGLSISIGTVEVIENEVLVYQFPCFKPIIKFKIAT
ncbi:hypothetical protein VCSRO90_2662 [Vibrio cholerae]|nr:hypothetical protein VCSRO90_2662 [Vibrio cholerae]